MEYELFIRSAFELALGKRVGQFEDPAEFADAGAVTAGNLNKIKVATGYAIGVITSHIRDKGMGPHEALDEYLGRVIAAGNVSEVVRIIIDFQENVTDKYFMRVEGVLQLK